MVTSTPSPARREVGDGIPVGVVSDVRLYRDGLANELRRSSEFRVAWTAGELDDAVARASEGTSRVVVIDMTSSASLRMVRAVRHAAPTLPIIAFAVHEVDHEVIACAEAGAAGFVPCDATLTDLIDAIRGTVRGEVICSPKTAGMLFRRLSSMGQHPDTRRHSLLTAREADVLALLERGLSNKEIAQRLHIQVATVKNHVHNVLDKLNVGTRSEAAASQRAIGIARSRTGAPDVQEEPRI